VGPFLADPATGDVYVILAVEWLSRWPEARASKKIDAPAIADFIYHNICCWYGIPESFRTNHGSGFDNQVMENLTETLRINHHRSTPYYPQSNGLVELLVQTFKNSLKRTIMDQIHSTEGLENEPSPHWAHLVDSLLYAYCCTPYLATSVSFAMLLFGQHLKLQGG